MAYPNAQDYVRAVQQPDRVFRVPALREAVFELHPLFGIPMPASGNAAVVFKAGVGGQDAALRFFIREDASSRERYAALGQHFTDRGIEDCVAHPTWIDDFRDGPPPKETGHPNYQRTGREWGRWMDTFPGLVIYTALLALSRRPESWATLHTGENILFCAEDFDPPFSTRAWQLLSGI